MWKVFYTESNVKITFYCRCWTIACMRQPSLKTFTFEKSHSHRTRKIIMCLWCTWWWYKNVHNALNSVFIQISWNENFLLVNSREFNIVRFSCKSDLPYLCSMDSVYVDGTLGYCLKYFLQVFTIHFIQNGYYIPLVFIFISNKHHDTYKIASSLLSEHCDFPFSFLAKENSL